MKKLFTFSLATMAAVSLAAGSSFACGEKSTASKTSGKDGKLASSSYSCSVAKKDGKLASSEKSCAAHKRASVNAAYANLPANAQTVAASHDATCGAGGTCQLVNISIKGMTCGGCEYGVKGALAKVDGVNHVVNVDYKEGIAQVCTAKKADHKAMTKAVSATGFEAQIIPAVAKTTTKATATSTLSNSKGHSCGVNSSAKAKNASAKSKTSAKKASAKTPAKGDTH